MGRAPCCDEKVALKKGPWTPDEDQKLVAYIQQHGHGSWRNLPERAGLARCGKSCRLRWTNYLRPDIKRGQFSYEEDQMIIQLHAILGNRWSAIASHLPRRTDNEIKNYWNTHLKKRLAQMGIDPVTHKTSATAGLAFSSAWMPLVSTQLTHTSQWSSALAEAEARLSKSQSPPSPPSLLTELIHATQPPHPSAYFMRSWKTKVEDMLRPTFGAVKLEPPNREHYSSTPHIPKTLQDWNTALGNQTTASPSPSPSSAMVPYPPPKPELLVDMFTEMPTPMTTSGTTPVAPSLDRPRNHHVLSFAGDGGVGLENHFSPTSILSGPDSESMCSGDSDSCFEFLSHQNDGTGMSAYHNFPLIDSECEHGAESVSMTDIPESFWQSEQQAESLLEDLKSITSEPCGHGLESIIPQLEFINSGEFDPQF